jgi:hypothetical protein
VSLIALIAAIPQSWGSSRYRWASGASSAPRTSSAAGRILAVISFVLIGLWAVIGTLVGMTGRLPVTSSTDQAAAAPSSIDGPNHSHRVAGAGNRVADAVSLEDEDPGASAARAAAQGEEGVLGPVEDR